MGLERWATHDAFTPFTDLAQKGQGKLCPPHLFCVTQPSQVIGWPGIEYFHFLDRPWFLSLSYSTCVSLARKRCHGSWTTLIHLPWLQIPLLVSQTIITREIRNTLQDWIEIQRSSPDHPILLYRILQTTIGFSMLKLGCVSANMQSTAFLQVQSTHMYSVLHGVRRSGRLRLDWSTSRQVHSVNALRTNWLRFNVSY